MINSLASYGSPVETLNISGNIVSDETILLIANNKRHGNCKKLVNVIVEDCPNISPEGMRALKIALMKAQANQGNQHLNSMMSAAKGRDTFAMKGELEFD